jgi:hypothetical protein
MMVVDLPGIQSCLEQISPRHSQNTKLCLHTSVPAVSLSPTLPAKYFLQPTFDVLYRDKKPIRILLSLSSSLKQSSYPIANDSPSRNMRRTWLMNVTPNFRLISNYVILLVFFRYLNVGSHHHEAKNIQDETMTVWR